MTTQKANHQQEEITTTHQEQPTPPHDIQVKEITIEITDTHQEPPTKPTYNIRHIILAIWTFINAVFIFKYTLLALIYLFKDDPHHLFTQNIFKAILTLILYAGVSYIFNLHKPQQP